MPQRLKVLISAYACEPGKGSEPEVGWQWCLQMARFHDITVLTRSNNREAIEAAVAAMPLDPAPPTFIYFDGGEFELWWKATYKLHRLYYIWWQRAVRRIIHDLCKDKQFDLLHHVTFAGYRYITGIWGHSVPSIWGPIGGMESIDRRLLPYTHVRELAIELFRNLNNFIQSNPTATFPARSKQSSMTIVSTRETQKCLNEWQLPSVLMPTIGLTMEDFPERARYDVTDKRPLRLLFVGQLIWLKGVDLAVSALSQSGTDATLQFIGSGPFRASLEKQAKKLGLGERVSFSPRIPRSQVMQELYNYDVFLFPSLHDSGGFAVLEAMVSGLPVICLDLGGPAISVVDDCGFRVAAASRNKVISEIADKIRYYDQNRDAVEAHGKNARSQVTKNYNWKHKGEEMNELYHRVCSAANLPQRANMTKTT